MNNKELLQRLDDLEIKLSFQENLIEELNTVISKQDQEILKLWDANRILKSSLNDMKSGNEGDAPEPPPPHY